jgi:hypothetical protein
LVKSHCEILDPGAPPRARPDLDPGLIVLYNGRIDEMILQV